MKELEYPFDSEYITRKKKSIKRELLQEVSGEPKRIAVLGGSTTALIKDMLEIFLLNYGIPCSFYESEYNQYYEDIMFSNSELEEFKPEIVFIHTTFRNLSLLPSVTDKEEDVTEKVEAVFKRFEGLWEKAHNDYSCVVIQNNFEMPYIRNLGSIDASDYRGYINFVNRINAKFAEYAETHDFLKLNDINYTSACFGLDSWSDPFYWQMYKYAVSVPAIPTLSFTVANIIKSLLGKNKKALSLDCDNTLWGGIIGDDGVENIEIGQETSLGQTFSEFHSYLKNLKNRGVVLTVNSKNDLDVAVKGFERPDSVLKPDDFTALKINWLPKSDNLINVAKEINLLPESFVFVDDNPAEREIVRSTVKGTLVPELTTPEYYAHVIDRSGAFEVTSLSEDDIKRSAMYAENAKRAVAEASFTDYGEYLKSLEMKAEIAPFTDIYMSRIAQLTNKSNQFNLTTKRYTQAEIEAEASDGKHITLYGKLEDKFGDNGVVSVAIGEIKENELHIVLWLMSCRVLKRDMEYAMMDEMVKAAVKEGITSIRGFYYPTAKNKMVKDFYLDQGFALVSEDLEGNREFVLNCAEHENKNRYISVN